MQTERFPLSWPTGWQRTPRRSAARFDRNRTLAQARDLLLKELRLLGARLDEVIVSSNVPLRGDGLLRSGQAQPFDPGVAIYFTLKNRQTVLACDRWNRVEDNLYAIAAHIGALRQQERYGVGTIAQAFAGYQALPAHKSWWEVLNVKPEATPEQVKAAFQELVTLAHPDRGGSNERLNELLRARDEWFETRGEKE